MGIKETLRTAIQKAAECAIADGVFSAAELADIALEVPPEKRFGDFSTNFAMQSARVFRMNPRKIAEEITSRIKGDWLDHSEIAGPGFINFYLNETVRYDMLHTLYKQGEAAFYPAQKQSAPIIVEYVSANPTGLLHVGHGRGAAVGSALVNLLRAAGYIVHSEYYINDAGEQIENLAASVNARYLELLGQEVIFPTAGYRGKDIIDTAKSIIEEAGDRYLSLSEKERLAAFKEIALKEKLARLKEHLAAFNVTFDEWFSERTLYPAKVHDAYQTLKEKGDVYEANGALWLRSTAYGDDKDRVVIRDNGVPTYLAADIAYHQSKFERGFSHLINIWGADHHGYVCRIKAAMQALGYDRTRLEVLLLQMVSLYRNGELVKMSKRTGKSVTLAELIEEVGKDAARYFFLARSLDSQLDFDLDLAKSKSNENPVYYIQYAHARIASICRQAKEEGLTTGDAPDFSKLVDETELSLIKKIEGYKEEIERAAKERAPHRIARFAYDTAGLFHSFYNRCRIIGEEFQLASARLALVEVTANVLRHALNILGISAPDKM